MRRQWRNLGYAIGGMVIKLDDATLWSRLGAHSRAPRSAYAINFISNLSLATISDIRVQVGLFGNLPPVADLVPTCLQNVTRNNAATSNFTW